ncbi:hypothetical protein K488DRAFT_50862 [Vararia minispora EC-137]|uniref:Uncharacterized protein n=1 Tax=Vararia minispora EC-137 TaxID=1314806 RepID=A0ACB8QKY5_9AGAM|nr:hypothetical protein K488DRAFT_50862 [Vararia minispora EC-137]
MRDASALATNGDAKAHSPSPVLSKATSALAKPADAPPPPVKAGYSHQDALEDLPCVQYALETFLQSKMVECEEYMHNGDPKKERLYFATGYGLIQCVKALMSYDDEDLLAAINYCKHGNAIAQQHRKKAAMLPFRLAGYVTGLAPHGVSFIQNMTPVERHAELTYAESLFEKALLGIVYSGDWLAFIKEALNMRTTFNVYRTLGKYVDAQDAAAQKRGLSEDPGIDAHFRSGVYLGVGMSNIILSLLPSRLISVIELFGYKGDRRLGLELLLKAGGWSKDSDGPAIGREEEGVRRSICDLALIIFHLVLSTFTSDGVDISIAAKIIDWNLKRYPNGVFFLFGQGRVALVRSRPREAIAAYERACAAQTQYRNMHHISFWEISCAQLALWDIAASLARWRILAEESTWSKATYTYAVAACLLQLGGEKNTEEALALVKRVPNLRQRIAGKSIPLEKFVARKARKAQAQRGLVLPALELAAVFGAIAHAPRDVLHAHMLPTVAAARAALDAEADKARSGYWDDVCLARFLEGMCLRFLAYEDAEALVEPDVPMPMPVEEATARARAAFEAVFADGTRIELDHYLVYFAHFEYGRLLARSGEKERAREQLELVYSGKYLEVNAAGRKGRYSLENALHLRTQAALEALEQGRRL